MRITEKTGSLQESRVTHWTNEATSPSSMDKAKKKKVVRDSVGKAQERGKTSRCRWGRGAKRLQWK